MNRSRHPASLPFLACLAVVLLGGAALATDEVTVVINGTGAGRPATVTFDSGEAINASNGLPTIESTDTRVNITTTSAAYNIGRITFAADSRSSDLELFLGSGSFPVAQSNLSEVGVNWAGIDTLPGSLVGKVKLAGAISGDLTDSLSVNRVFRLEVGGQVQAAARPTTASTPTTSTPTAWSTPSTRS